MQKKVQEIRKPDLSVRIVLDTKVKYRATINCKYGLNFLYIYNNTDIFVGLLNVI